MASTDLTNYAQTVSVAAFMNDYYTDGDCPGLGDITDIAVEHADALSDEWRAYIVAEVAYEDRHSQDFIGTESADLISAGDALAKAARGLVPVTDGDWN